MMASARGHSSDGAAVPVLHSVAMVGIVLRDAHVLIVQRADNLLWEPPAGILELDESFRACVTREVLEETGVTVEALHITGVYKNVRHPLRPVAIAWLCSYVSGEPQPSPESVSVEWVPIEVAGERLREAHLARVLDAVHYEARGHPATRVHDGDRLIDEGGSACPQ